LMTLRVDWLQKGFKKSSKVQENLREKIEHVVILENQTEWEEAKPRWHDFCALGCQIETFKSLGKFTKQGKRPFLGLIKGQNCQYNLYKAFTRHPKEYLYFNSHQ